MAERRERDELSPETEQLIRELGELLAHERWLRYARVTAMSAIRPLSDSHSRQVPSRRDLTRLEAPLQAIVNRRSGGFWLYGVDARARRDALEQIALSLAPDATTEWTTAVLELGEGTSPRDRWRWPWGISREAAEVSQLLERAWDRWGEEKASSRRRGWLEEVSGDVRRWGRLAIVLPEFPWQDHRAIPFLGWLRRGRAKDVTVLVIVEAEAPLPSALRGRFRPVHCETEAERRGRLIASRRLRRGWTRRQLARRAGVPVTTLAKLEGGIEAGVTAEAMRRVAEALGLSPEALNGDT
ncbi:MAG TPA: helix-turn-helix transcriptional regulator [Dehalococcoidia bacterium]|nr:helix-turn-helix transcriptional regulator [Dehalococcoidia bacterium]